MRIGILTLIVIMMVGLVACQFDLRPMPQPVHASSATDISPTVSVPQEMAATVAPTPTRSPTFTPTSTALPTLEPTVAPTAQPTSAPTAVPLRVQVDSPEVGYLNVRDAPSTGGAVVVQAKDGALLDVLEAADVANSKVGQSGQWLEVRTSDGKEGFVAAWYVRLPGSRPVLPTAVPNPALDAVVDLLNRANALRAQNGLPPYGLNAKLNAAAERHSQDMSNTGNIDHTGSDGSKVSQRIADTGYEARYTGENIYGGRVTVDAAWAYWRDDPPHRANLLSTQFTEIGVSVVKGARGWYYFTMDLAHPTR